MRSYLKPEEDLMLKQMITMFKLRTDMVDLPGSLPFKYVLGKNCRAGCYAVEDVFHLIDCANDQINDKDINQKDLENVFNDSPSINNVKKMINKLKRIMQLKINICNQDGQVNLKNKKPQTLNILSPCLTLNPEVKILNNIKYGVT